jgi:signal transduction histidine kinase
MASSDVPELTISTAVEDDDMVAVDVADIGSRIAPERMSQLFQPFVTETAWDGVGLSICRTIVEAHG